ncbi:hypothetical protein LCGC14_2738310 [marine sediment metagenome]|uniref:Uncharacterized protein n=1 Tax=marine sediment metagenome TaxID=412755 RepID=A0A0F8ZSI1_9ZZZZ
MAEILDWRGAKLQDELCKLETDEPNKLMCRGYLNDLIQPVISAQCDYKKQAIAFSELGKGLNLILERMTAKGVDLGPSGELADMIVEKAADVFNERMLSGCQCTPKKTWGEK